MTFGRDMLRSVEGYVPGEQPTDPAAIKLNTNENPYPPSPAVLEALSGLSEGAMRRYPDTASVELRTACAARYGYDSPDWVIAGNGMDELLAMALRTFVDPGDTVVTAYPTYVIYETLTQLHGAVLKTVDLDGDFQLPESFYSESGRMCFLSRPNAPSGVSVPRADVERLCESFSGIVVIDEAYADFAEDTCMDFPKRFENAIVMRTFSKAYSLAGLRIGVAVASPTIIQEFFKTKDSYNLNAYSQAAGIAAIRDHAHMEANTAKIRATRTRLIAELRTLGFSVPDSQTNFVLARCEGDLTAKDLFQRLRGQSIYVRYFSERRLDNALRISVGSDLEIDSLLNALKEIIG